ncbi:MAG: MerR family transcriptional regulator [Halanaerobiaceae bacterium]
MAGKKNIPMRVVKEETGLTSRQIRYYDEMKLVFPERTKGNQRLFSREDISRLKKIKSLLQEGYTIEAIKKKLNQPRPVRADKTAFQRNRWTGRLNKGDLSSRFPVTNKSNSKKLKGKE